MALPQSLMPAFYHALKITWAGLDLFYPPECGGCGILGSRWCSDCQEKVKVISGTICEKCGNQTDQEGICDLCQTAKADFVMLRSWALYDGPVREAIKRLKYSGDISLGEILARPLIRMFKSLNWRIDIVVPVPAGVARRQQRGYNQAGLLAFPLSLGIKHSYCPGALVKVRDVRSQVGLSWVERRENVKKAFHASAPLVDQKSVMVVDDITTSGATLEECASALKKAGATEIYGLTLARASRPDLMDKNMN